MDQEKGVKTSKRDYLYIGTAPARINRNPIVISTPVHCSVDVPDDFRPRAWYSLRMLLLPLGLRPERLEEDPATNLHQGIYYGPYPDRYRDRSRVWATLFGRSTGRFFAAEEPYPPSRVRWSTLGDHPVPVLFPLKQPPSRGPKQGDLIASTFFWLSGWQEYTSSERDVHGRFPYHRSLQKQWDLALTPVVDLYRNHIAHRLVERGLPVARRRWDDRDWAFCPTHDIDRVRPGGWKKLISIDQWARLRRGTTEPADRQQPQTPDTSADSPGRSHLVDWDRIVREEEARDIRSTFFIKTGKPGRWDHPYSLRSTAVRTRLAYLRTYDFEIGLHPGYFSYDHPYFLQNQQAQLEEAVGEPIRSVRQHYLRYIQPATSRYHELAGMQIDSTIGFSTHEGFRRGTTVPFQIFDLGRNETLNLWEMPLMAMDATLFSHRGYDLTQARMTCQRIADVCQEHGGVFVGLWHNHIFQRDHTHGMGQHFLSILDYARDNGARIGPLYTVLDEWKDDRG